MLMSSTIKNRIIGPSMESCIAPTLTLLVTSYLTFRETASFSGSKQTASDLVDALLEIEKRKRSSMDVLLRC
jgi:hypothetical protein